MLLKGYLNINGIYIVEELDLFIVEEIGDEMECVIIVLCLLIKLELVVIIEVEVGGLIIVE